MTTYDTLQVDIGNAPNDDQGDPLRTAFDKINQRFVELRVFLNNRGDWAPNTVYTATPNRDWVIVGGVGYLATGNHTSGATFAADLAAGRWFEADAINVQAALDQLRADLASSAAGKGAELVAGVDTQIADYPSLRAYTGAKTRVYVTGTLGGARPSGIAGVFQHDATDTTSADNGGTIIVGAAGRRWKRDFDSEIDLVWFDVLADGADQTNKIVSIFNDLASTGFRGYVNVKYGTKFNAKLVYAAVPVGVVIKDDSGVNFGQPPGYKNKFNVTFSGDVTADDSQQVVASGHHAAITLLNTGYSGTNSGNERRGTILHGVNIDYKNDMMFSFINQYSKAASAEKWQVAWRLQTPYEVAIANPQLWASLSVYQPGAYCISDGGKVYKTIAGGTSGNTGPSGTGSSINDGGVLWDFVQSRLGLDSTIFYIDESGELYLKAPSGTSSIKQVAGAKNHYISIESTNGDITWRDVSRGLNLLSLTNANGLQFGVAQSLNRLAISGATPNAPSTGSGRVTNVSAVNMTGLTPVSGRAKMVVSLRFDDANTTLIHGTGANNFALKGNANVTPQSGSFISFEYDSSYSTRWFETSRNF